GAGGVGVLQVVVWEAWRGAAGYDPTRGTPEAWIVMRARTRAIDRIRALRRRGETFVAPLDEAVAGAPPPSGGDAGDRAAERQLVATALAQLPAAQREVIELAYYAGLSHSEIAARLAATHGHRTTSIRTPLSRVPLAAPGLRGVTLA